MPFEGEYFASIPDKSGGGQVPQDPLPQKHFSDGPERAHYAIIIRKRTSLGA